jgi:MFS family permease
MVAAVNVTEVTKDLDPSVWKVVAVTVIGSFLSQLNATIVTVSLASLASELHSSLATIQWVTSGYLLALTLALPLNGWLVDRMGPKAVYLWCFTAFTLSSALAPTIPTRIAFWVTVNSSTKLMSGPYSTVTCRAIRISFTQRFNSVNAGS